MADAVFSIGVRYAQCQNAVHHLARTQGWRVYRGPGTPYPERAQQNTVRQLLATLAAAQNPAADLFNNRGYANPRAAQPILKAELLRSVAQVLDTHGIQVFQDLSPWPEKLDETLAALPAMSSGIIVRYLRMLAGDANGVKPDRMIVRFIERALNRKVSPEEAVELIRGTARSLQQSGYPHLDARLLDHLIWNHQRSLVRPKNKSGLTVTATLLDKPAILHDRELKFEEFWICCRTGGDVGGSLKFGVDEDERLEIKSKNSKSEYRIIRSTVKTYLAEVHKRKFRANHGWFSKVHDHILRNHAHSALL
jgi:hypothetical protein